MTLVQSHTNDTMHMSSLTSVVSCVIIKSEVNIQSLENVGNHFSFIYYLNESDVL